MNIFTKSIAAAFVIATAPIAASAVTIDFDALDSSSGQTVPLITFTEDGFEFELSFTDTPGGSGVEGPAIFDSANPVNGDTDLSPLAQGDNGISGNILILQEAGSDRPDDAASAGTITMKLLSGPAFRFLGASAIDDTDFTFSSVIGGTTTQLGKLDFSVEGNLAGGTGSLTFASPSNFIGVGDSILIEYGGSGGVDSLVLAPVPVPAGLPLFLAGLGAFGYMKRRKAAVKA